MPQEVAPRTNVVAPRGSVVSALVRRVFAASCRRADPLAAGCGYCGGDLQPDRLQRTNDLRPPAQQLRQAQPTPIAGYSASDDAEDRVVLARPAATRGS